MHRIVISLVFAVLFSTSLSAQVTQTPPPTTSAPQATGDPQALAAAQAALTALGGAAAISQIQGWTFQASMEGGAANGTVTYAIDTQPSSLTMRTKKGTKRTVMLHSFFVPAVVAALLAKQLADSTYSTQQMSLTSSESKPVRAISIGPTEIPVGQIWLFDNATNLPLRIEFRLPAELGSRLSFPGTVDLSDYRNVGGILYPFRIVTQLRGGLPEIITIQSVTPSATTPTVPNMVNSEAGDRL